MRAATSDFWEFSAFPADDRVFATWHAAGHVRGERRWQLVMADVRTTQRQN
jgi:hypothetical protein